MESSIRWRGEFRHSNRSFIVLNRDQVCLRCFEMGIECKGIAGKVSCIPCSTTPDTICNHLRLARHVWRIDRFDIPLEDYPTVFALAFQKSLTDFKPGECFGLPDEQRLNFSPGALADCWQTYRRVQYPPVYIFGPRMSTGGRAPRTMAQQEARASKRDSLFGRSE